MTPTPIQRQLAEDAAGRGEAVRSYSQFVRLAAPPGLTVTDVDGYLTRLTQVHPMLSARLDREPEGDWHLSQTLRRRQRVDESVARRPGRGPGRCGGIPGP